MNTLLKFFFFFTFSSILVLQAATTDLQTELQQDIQNEHLERFTLIEAAFILSGAVTPDSISLCLKWYHTLLGQLKAYHFDSFDREGSAAKVFGYLHSTWLITYKEQATTLLDIIRRKQFNCVAATILYNLLCSDLGWSTEAFETPTHTYTLFSNFAERLMVENTTPMGFNITRNLHEYSQYLLQFYPQNRAAQIGFDRIYAYENSKGRVINNTELLGLLAYNRAYLAEKQGDYDQAYQFVMLAQKFNRDSRSNVNFEISLYHRWGQKLFDQGRFYQAFTVMADGFYRYRDNQELASNCKIAMLNTLNQYNQNRDWQKTRELLLEFHTLKLSLDEPQIKSVRAIMEHWLQQFIRERQNNELVTVIDLMEQIGVTDDALVALRRQTAN